MRNIFIYGVMTIFSMFDSQPASAADSAPAPSNASVEKGTDSTHLDFDSALIDGHMKAPTGFFLQGRNKQSLSNMVRLRADFREHLRNSKTAVKAIIH